MTSAAPPARTSPFLGSASDDVVDRILTRFHSGSALVVAALVTLETLASRMVTIATAVPETSGSSVSTDLAPLMAEADALLTDATDGENLLRRDGDSRAFLVLGLARATSGKLSVQPIEIDRGQIALIDAGKGPWDLLRGAAARLPQRPTDQDLRMLRAAIAAVDARIAIARSRLSIVKTRLDLQSSFLNAIVESEPASSVVRLDSSLDQTGVHTMALEARRLLARHTFTIGNTNRAAVRTLFERHA
jgi:hypothetical protein